jgi:membrane complex biogenesis BtpA family protein
MVHLLPLPGSPGAATMTEVVAAALRDAERLAEAGFDGLVVENFGDAPFEKDRVAPITIAAMARVATEILRCTALPLCVNVLRNDARSALAVAVACGAQALRVNIHSGARLTDQGIIEGRAAETLRERAAWGGREVAIWADVAVKHSTSLGNPPRSLEDEVPDLVKRGKVDAVIVSGAATGAVVSARLVARVVDLAGGCPVLIGSGVDESNVAQLLQYAASVIVGTSIKEGAKTTAPVDLARARALVQVAQTGL